VFDIQTRVEYNVKNGESKILIFVNVKNNKSVVDVISNNIPLKLKIYFQGSEYQILACPIGKFVERCRLFEK